MVFNGLLKHLEHHSLTELLIELMKLNFRTDGWMLGQTAQSKWSDEEEDKTDPAKK